MRGERLARAWTRCSDAYDRVEQLPRGTERAAAWAAYALVTYADKLVGAAGHADDEVAHVALAAYDQAGACLEEGAVPARLPHWPGTVRSEQQLRGMRDTLDALRTFIAFDLRSGASEELTARLAAVDRRLQKVDTLFVPRAPVELRGGIAGELVAGLDEAYDLGRAAAVYEPSL